MKRNKMRRIILKARILSKHLRDKFQGKFTDTSGRIGFPILMYMLGIPGIACLFAWLFLFKA